MSGIKSKPVYTPLSADLGGRYHLMLALGPGGIALLRVLKEIERSAPDALGNTRVLLVADSNRASNSSVSADMPRSVDVRGPASSAGSDLTRGSAGSTATRGTRSSPEPVGTGGTTGSAKSAAAGGTPGSAETAAAGGTLSSVETAAAGGTTGSTKSAAAGGTLGSERSGGPAELSGAVKHFQEIGPGELTVFDDAAAMLVTFRTVLEESLMGTRLYVAGPESFIGLVMKIAREFDLNKDEIRAEEMGSLARRVYCIHCRTTSEDVKTNIVRCCGCDRWLLVRDHYSRRLAAYMGVMVDAEAPGELPPIKELYP